MAKKTAVRKAFTMMSLLQFVLGMLFLLRGLHGITVFGTSASQVGQALSRAFGVRTAVFELLIILVELGCGGVIIASYFVRTSLQLRKQSILAVTVIWAVLMVVFDILMPNFHSRYFDWLLWGQQLSFHLVVLISLFMVRKSVT